MFNIKSGLTNFSNSRYFGLFIITFILMIVVGGYFVHEHRYKISVLIDDYITENSNALIINPSNKPKLIATYRDKPPSMYLYSENHFSGPLRFVLEEAASKIGYEVEWKQAALSASLAGLLDSSIDIVPHIRSKTAERQRLYRYSVSLMTKKRSIYLALHNEETKSITKLDDLKDLKVGYQKGNHFSNDFQQSKTFIKKPYLSVELMVMAFNRNEIDVMVVSSKRLMEQQLKSIGASPVKYAEFTIDDTPGLHFLYSQNPQKQSVYDQLDNALLEMKAQGVINDIFRSFTFTPSLKE